MKKKPQWALVMGWILFISLVGSIVFAICKLSAAPADGAPAAPGMRFKSDYALMLLQCAAGLLVMFLPSMLEKRWKIEIPNNITVLFFLFLYCAIYLGEVRNFYFRIPHWDTYLHYFSAAMLGALGFSLVSILNDDPHISLHISPKFVCLFAFCFALALGVLWEVYEFTFDGLLGLNMQKFRLEDGTALVGRAALSDTMKDLIVDALGALGVTLLGALSMWRQRRKAPSQ